METRRISFKRVYEIERRALNRYTSWKVQARTMHLRVKLAQNFRDRVLRRWAKWVLGSEDFTIEVIVYERRILFTVSKPID